MYEKDLKLIRRSVFSVMKLTNRLLLTWTPLREVESITREVLVLFCLAQVIPQIDCCIQFQGQTQSKVYWLSHLRMQMPIELDEWEVGNSKEIGQLWVWERRSTLVVMVYYLKVLDKFNSQNWGTCKFA